ncbi:hypothetical protein PR003_g967 [Phytophthora rubi]|uniref:Uncharacterized protein n=1 Tax=Phytophthora rubi TaxID=129364 RepID=A0A6A4G4H6_9STRA|nr:hypothetical protein PR002_g920 [Phytophthora rubi]KAE9052393.1 hypothetical protein PR001_g561 [Phytophthora rubi]KAE9359018.1 hypothetical protein PR003_g967 [Phytophthora rubi]
MRCQLANFQVSRRMTLSADVESDAATVAQPASIDAAQPRAQSIGTSDAPETLEISVQSDGDEGGVDDSIEALEDLILEAYNNMQIDGEYIFLPDEVAEKLHRVTEQMNFQDSGEEKHTENNTSAGEDSRSGDAVDKKEEEQVKSSQQTSTDRPEPEQEQDQEQQETLNDEAHMQKTETRVAHSDQENLGEDEQARQRKVKELQAEAAELREEKHKQRIPRAVSSENLFTELEPVPEIDESASSGPPSPSPPHSRSHSGANTPKPRAHTPARGHGHFPPPPIISLSSTPSSAAASPDQIGKSPASRTSDQSGGSKRKAKVLTYEKRREAAFKLKQDKKKRELLIRESARKQREDAKRELEEVHQKEMEEKRERVRRIREERLHRQTGKCVKGSKKVG